LLGFGFGGLASYAAILHMIYHSLFKSLLFLLAGNIAVRYSSSKVINIRGLIDTLPITNMLWVGALLAVIGMPPFGMFWTEFTILATGAKDHLIIAIILAISLILIFVGISRAMFSMIFGYVPQHIVKGETNYKMMVPLIILFLTACGVSVFLPPFLQVLLQSAQLSITP
jgi:hydrogenase-4 component F